MEFDTGRFVRVNRRYCELTGYSREELLSMNIRDITHPDDRMLQSESYGRYRNREIDRLTLEKRYLRKDGTVVWVQVNATPTTDASGRKYSLGVIQDVTAQKLTEEQLRLSEQRLRGVIETTPEWVKIVSPDARILEVNPAGLEILAANDRAEVIGRSVYEFVSPEFREAYRTTHESVCRGNAETLQYQVIARNGTRRWVESHAAPFRMSDAGPTFHLAVTRDITSRRSAEEALRESESLSRVRRSMPCTNTLRSWTNQEGSSLSIEPGASLRRAMGGLMPRAESESIT